MKAMDTKQVKNNTINFAKEFLSAEAVLWVKTTTVVEAVSPDKTKVLKLELNNRVYRLGSWTTRGEGLRIVLTDVEREGGRVFYKLNYDPRATGWCYLDELIYDNPEAVGEFEES